MPQIRRALTARVQVMGMDPGLFFGLLGVAGLAVLTARSLTAVVYALGGVALVPPLVRLLQGGDPWRLEILCRSWRSRGYYRPLPPASRRHSLASSGRPKA